MKSAQRARTVVAGLVFDDRGDVLMQLRKATSLRPNMWEYVAGKVEASDRTLPFALKREVREELGCESQPGRYLGCCQIPFENGGAHVVLYRLELLGVPRAIESQEIRYVDVEHAIRHMPCVPSVYLFYPHVLTARRLYLRELREASA